ncbi:MAG TPA: nitroreductase family deazaflavin-dependent oxidoreductase [Candidatus Binatia bacterium]|nr:nitroreductase family deazaflavin-dependent oxidoreductase [Candidatus Binatia bacterium]
MSVGLRLLKAIGESSFWRRTGRLHTWLYRSTGGRIGHRAGQLANLLLTTTGRRSGAERTVPLTYMADGERFVLVASNGGSDRHPAWWLNLREQPHATVQVGSRTLAVVAHQADAVERARLWPKLKAMNPFYAAYERITSREIPVVVLEPVR